MNITEIEADIAFINGISADADKALKLEIKLYKKFIKLVAKEGDGDIKKMAKVITKTWDGE